MRQEPRDLGMPSNHKTNAEIRDIKLMVPLCRNKYERATSGQQGRMIFEGCQDRPGARETAWWEACSKRGHDPYYHEERRSEFVTAYEDEEDESGNFTGRRKVVGQQEVVWEERMPNLKQVSLTGRVGGIKAGMTPVDFAISHGCLHVTDHPTLPLKPFCQYHGCWCQKIAVSHPRYGDYCDEYALRRIIMDARGTAFEVLNHTRRIEQIEQINITR